jgi:hypothetical protein
MAYFGCPEPASRGLRARTNSYFQDKGTRAYSLWPRSDQRERYRRPEVAGLFPVCPLLGHNPEMAPVIDCKCINSTCARAAAGKNYHSRTHKLNGLRRLNVVPPEAS